MPGRVYSALNTGGTPYTTPADDQAARNQAQSADWMLQQAMMQQRAQQFQASLADKQNDRLAQRDIQGTYSQRAAGDQQLEGLRGQYGLENTRLTGQNQANYIAGVNQPRNRELDYAKQIRDEEAPLRQPALVQAGIKGRLLQGFSDRIGGQGAAPVAGASPYKMTADERSLLGLGVSPEAEDARSQKNVVITALMKGLDNPDQRIRAQVGTRLAQMGVPGFDAGADPQSKTGQFDHAPGPVKTGEQPADIVNEPFPYLGKSQVTSANLEDIIKPELQDYVNNDSQSWWSRGLKGAGSGALGGAGAGALASSWLGPGALLGGALGGAGGGVGGFLGGAFSANAADPGQDQQDRLVTMYLNLVKKYTAETGDPEYAKQKARLQFKTLAQTSDQGSDALTDWDADKTRQLFDRLK